MRQGTVGLAVVITLCLLAAGRANAQLKPPSDLVFSEMPEDVKAETQNLYSDNAAQQIAAAKKLGAMGAKAKPAIKYMIGVLGEDVSGSVRQAIVQALIKLGDPAKKALTGASKHPIPEIRRMVVVALGNLKDPSTVDALAAAVLNDEDATVRQNAVAALMQIEGAGLVEKMLAAIEDDKQKPEVTARAIKALGLTGDSSAVEPLTALLEDSGKDIRIRCFAADALGRMKHKVPSVVKPLLGALKDKKPDIRVWAAWALNGAQSPEVVKPLSDVLAKDADHRVRIRAADALALTQDPKAVKPLIDALQDDHADVRLWATLGLGGFMDRKAVGPLNTALMDSDDRVRLRAVESLGKIGGDQAIMILIGILNSVTTSGEVRGQAARALGQLKDARATAPLIVALGAPEAEVRRWAASSLGRIGGDRAREELIRALTKDQDPTVRGWAALALARIGDPQASAPLIKALGDEDASVRGQAALALGQLGDPEAQKALETAANDSDPNVQARAKAALEQLKN